MGKHDDFRASGELRIGRIRDLSFDDIIECLKECRLHITGDEDAQVLPRQYDDSVAIRAKGPGVLGFLVDSEGLEAPLSDIECFAERVLAPGEELEVRGHHYISSGSISLNKMTMSCSDDGIVIVRRSHAYTANEGARQVPPEPEDTPGMES